MTPNRQQTPGPSSYTAMYMRPVNIGAMAASSVPRTYLTPPGASHSSASTPYRSSTSAAPHPSSIYTTTPNPSVLTPVLSSGRSLPLGTPKVSVPLLSLPPQIPPLPQPILPNALNFGGVDGEDEEEDIDTDDESSASSSPNTPYHTLKALYKNNRKKMKYIFSASFGMEDVISIDDDTRFPDVVKKKSFKKKFAVPDPTSLKAEIERRCDNAQFIMPLKGWRRPAPKG